MTKKLAIFGNSFGTQLADPAKRVWELMPSKERKIEFRKAWYNEMPSWIRMFKNEYDVVHTFAVGNTGIDYSYLQFLRYHNEYDAVIFITTRAWTHSHIQYGNQVEEWRGEASIHDIDFIRPEWMLDERPINCHKKFAEKILKSNNKPTGPEMPVYDEDVINLMKVYVDYGTHVVQKFPFRDLLQWASMIDNIIRTRPDVKMINTSPEDFNDLGIKIPIGKIQTLHRMENDILLGKHAEYEFRKAQGLPLDDDGRLVAGLDEALQEMPILKLYSDARVGHLSTEAHRLIYAEIKDLLASNNTWLDFDLDAMVKKLMEMNLDKKRYFVAEHKDIKSWAKYNNLWIDEEVK